MASDNFIYIGDRKWIKVVNADGSDFLDDNDNMIYVDEAGNLLWLHFKGIISMKYMSSKPGKLNNDVNTQVRFP